MPAYIRIALICLVVADATYAHAEWRFHTLSPPSEAETELFSEILVNDDGSLWAAIWGGGCVRLSGSEWEIFGKEDGLATLSARCIARDGANGVWVGTDKGLCHIAYDEGQITTYNKANTPGLSSDNIMCLMLRRDGVLLVGLDDRKLVAFQKRSVDSPKVAPISGETSPTQGDSDFASSAESPQYACSNFLDLNPYGNVARDVAEEANGALWISLSALGLLRYDNGEVERFDQNNSEIVQAKLLHLDDKGDLWVAGGPGLLRYDGTTWTVVQDSGSDPVCVGTSPDGDTVVSSKEGFRIFLNDEWVDLKLGETIGTPDIRGIAFGPRGLIWLSSREGLFMGTPPIWESYTQTSEDLAFSGQTFCVSPKYGPLATTIRNHVARFNGSWKTLFQAPIEGYLISIALAPEDGLWILGKDRIALISLEDGAIRQIWKIPDDIKPQGLRVTAEGKPWLLTKGPIYGHDGDAWTPLFQDSKRKGKQVFGVCETPNREVFLCYEYGVERWIDGKVEYLEDSFPLMKGKSFSTAYCDREGKVWIGASGLGLLVFHKGHIRPISMRDGMASAHVWEIYQAIDGSMWVGYLKKGMGWYRDGRWVNYSYRHGLPNSTFMNIGEWPEGVMWASVKEEKIFRFVPDSGRPDTRILAAPTVVDSHGIGTFSFSGLDTWSATRKDDLEFSWRVVAKQGAEKNPNSEWSPYEKDTTVRTRPLRAGKYAFQVRAADESRNEDPAPDEWLFTVEKPFYLRTGFLAPIITLGLIVLILLLYAYRKHLKLVRSEEELRKNEASLAKAQKIARLGSWEWNVKKGLSRWSSETYEIFEIKNKGQAPAVEDLITMTHSKDRPLLAGAINQASREGREFNLEHRIITTGGKQRHVQHRGVTQFDSNGVIVQVLGTIHDITESKQAEEEKLALETKLHQARKMESLNTMAGSIAHHFNNLLMAVLGNLDMAAETLPLDAPETPCLSDATEAGRRAAKLSQLMLVYVGQGKKATRQFDLNETIGDALKALNAAAWTDTTLETQPSEEPLFVWGDASQMKQVVVNLVMNAVEALEEVEGTISVKTGRVNRQRKRSGQLWLGDDLRKEFYAYLEIEDNGLGIDKDIMPKIFDPFFTTHFTGRGLGLATVLGIVRGHRGSIEVSSGRGEGSKFTIFLPLSEVE